MSYVDTIGGSGSVTGTGTDNTIVRWDGTTSIQDSAIALSDVDAQGSTGFSIASTTYQFVRGGVSKGDVGFVATQKLATLTVKAGANITGLTGTTTVNGSTSVTGSGTLFLEELSELDRISVSTASTTYRSVKNITSNTALTVSGSLGSGASAKTINRKRAIQTWRNASGTFIGGIDPDGGLLIGGSNANDIYLSDILYGTLTVVQSTHNLIASFHAGGSQLAAITGAGHLKSQTGSSGLVYPNGNVFSQTWDTTSTAFGGLVNIFSQTITAYMLNTRFDAVRIKIFGDADNGTARFYVKLGADTLLDFTPGVSVVGHWEINCQIMYHSGEAKVKCITTITTSPNGGGAPDGATQYAYVGYDTTVNNTVSLDVDDFTLTTVSHQGSVSEWVPSNEN